MIIITNVKDKYMRRILRYTYKLGKATTKLPKVSFSPFKSVYRAFKAGRDDAKHTATTVN